MKCVKCGKTLKSNEKFCTNCGYYNDEKEDNNILIEETKDDSLDENWYEDEVEANTKDEEEKEIIIEEVKKEKPKKEKKVKEKKPKEEVKEQETVEKVIPIEDKKEIAEKPKKEKKQKEIIPKNVIREDKSKEFYSYENEKYLEAYIGEDYKIIKKSPFNIWAFILNWMYLLYRKLFVTGIIGLIITTLVAFFLTKYFLIYLVVMLLILGFGFNPYYIYISKNKVDKILKEYEGSDSFTLEKICRELGGVNTVFSLIIYAIFLVVIILSITGVNFVTTGSTKFFKENSENEANCASLVRLAYNQEANNYKKIDEAICKVSKTKEKEYTIYLKTSKNNKIVYIYYETEKDFIVYKNNTSIIPLLEEKEKSGTLTTEDMNLLSDLKMVKKDYNVSYKKSLEEDKLIKTKKDKEEKHNYIFSYEELIR